MPPHWPANPWPAGAETWMISWVGLGVAWLWLLSELGLNSEMLFGPITGRGQGGDSYAVPSASQPAHRTNAIQITCPIRFDPRHSMERLLAWEGMRDEGWGMRDESHGLPF